VKGLKAEDRVANSLRGAGAHVIKSPGSRGSADLIATWNTGKEWMVQVKYSKTGRPAGLSSQEQKNLVSRANRHKATPVLAQVTPGKIKYLSVKSKREIKP